jgi:hypothetical protein
VTLLTPAEVNALVAEKVMGWPTFVSLEREVVLEHTGKPVPEFFTSIADASEMEDEIERRGLKWKYTQALVSLPLFLPDMPEFKLDEDLWWFLIHASPEHRCFAALKVLGVEIPVEVPA